jgi:hypothetical protein
VTARPFLNQADPAWAKVKAGLSRSKTLRNCGCLLTDLAQILRDLGVEPFATPVTVQARAIAAWNPTDHVRMAPFTPGTAAAVVVVVGAANGLTVGPRINRIEGAVMWSALLGALPHGRVLLHVDETPDNAKDDPVHWVCANGVDGSDVLFSDPDGGLAGRLPLETLTGEGPSGKPYKVSGIRVVTKA